MDIECRGGRVAFKGGFIEVGNCAKFCRRAIEKLMGMSRRVFHTPWAWVFVLNEGIADVEERLFIDACRVSGPREVIEHLARLLSDELGVKESPNTKNCRSEGSAGN